MTMRSLLSVMGVLIIASTAGTLATLPRAEAAQEGPCNTICNFNEQTTLNASPALCYGGSSFVTSNKAVGTCNPGCMVPCQYDITVTVNAATGVNCNTLEIRQNGVTKTVCGTCSSLQWQGNGLTLNCSTGSTSTDTFETRADGIVGAQHVVTCLQCQ